MTDRELSSEVLMLSLRCQQGVATEEERARLEYLLADDEEARVLYNYVACDTATLTEVADKNSVILPDIQDTLAGEIECVERTDEISYGSLFWRRDRWLMLAGLACLLLLSAWVLFGARPASDSRKTALVDTSPLGRIVYLDEVEWQAGSQAFDDWSEVHAGDSLQIAVGMVELVIDNAIQVVLQGPADFELVSHEKAIAHSGKLVARVGKEGIGFEIETPHAQVVDQGTAFSISVTPDSQTDIVVYEGSVDLAPRLNAQPAFRRLKSGEGMRVNRAGELNRITSVECSNFLPPLRLGRKAMAPSRLIASVTDNVSSLDTSKYYRIVGEGFEEDCVVYVDRLHQWNGLDERGIPSFLRGADYVMTFNDDKVLGDLQIAIEVTQPVSMYVMWDDRIEVPAWLSQAFVDTGWDIGLDEGFNDRYPDDSRQTALGAGNSVDFVFSIWKQDIVHASTVLLGSVQGSSIDEKPREVSQSMYGIAVTPLSHHD